MIDFSNNKIIEETNENSDDLENLPFDKANNSLNSVVDLH